MEKINIGMVGLNFGRHIVEEHLLRGAGEPMFRLAGICDLNQAKLQEASAKYGIKAYPSLDDLLADESIGAIGLFVGPAGRAKLIRKIIRAGKHVMTTKPLELDPEAALEVLNEARQLKKVVHLNSPSPLPHPHLKQIMAWREKYNLGKLVGARFEVWTQYREKEDGTWYDDPQQCPVAPVFRLGIYGINDLVRLLGRPEAVQVMHSRLFTQRPTADNGHLSIRFEGGAIASVFASFCINDRPGYHVALRAYYQNGSVQYGPDGELQVQSRRAEGEKFIESAVISAHSTDYQWDSFYRACRGETLEGEICPEEMVAGIRIVQAMTRAQSSGVTEMIV